MCRRMDLPPFASSEAGHKASDVPGGDGQDCSRGHVGRKFLNIPMRRLEMLDGIPQTSDIDRTRDSMFEKVPCVYGQPEFLNGMGGGLPGDVDTFDHGKVGLRDGEEESVGRSYLEKPGPASFGNIREKVF